MAQIPEEKIAEVRDRLDIVEVIGRSVALKKQGRSWKGSCPFHHEKTPSFHVDPDRNLYHCFGCQAGGDVIGFVMEHEGRTFPEAIRALADEVGVSLPAADEGPTDPAAKAKRQHKERLMEANEKAAALFTDWLMRSPVGGPGREHLQQRGISAAVARDFGLGFAPLRNDLRQRLVRAGVPESVIQEAGLVARGERGSYERFRGRLMVPIRDGDGGAIAFGARLVEGDHPAKYLNSPETTLYRKSTTLYGLDRARPHIRRAGAVMVVEGYFDVIALAQAGIDNAVATCGTALTREHCSLIERHARDVYLVFDGDVAGSDAAIRAHETVSEFPRLNVRVVRLPDAEDPDTFVRNHGAEAMRELCEQARPLAQLLLERALSGVSLAVEDKVRALERVRPILARVRDPLAHRLYVETIADRLALDERSVEARLREVRQGAEPSRREKGRTQETGVSAPIPADEEALCLLVLETPGLLRDGAVEDVLFALVDGRSRALLKEMITQLRSREKVDVGTALECVEDPSLRVRWRAYVARVSVAESGCDPEERFAAVARRLSLVLDKLARKAESRRRAELARSTQGIADPIERARRIQAEKKVQRCRGESRSRDGALHEASQVTAEGGPIPSCQE